MAKERGERLVFPFVAVGEGWCGKERNGDTGCFMPNPSDPDPFLPESFADSDGANRSSASAIGPPKRSLPCDCPPAQEGEVPIAGECDPHPGGWCRYCGRLLKTGGAK